MAHSTPPSWLLWSLVVVNIPSLLVSLGNLQVFASALFNGLEDASLAGLSLLYCLVAGFLWVEAVRVVGASWFAWHTPGWLEVGFWVIDTAALLRLFPFLLLLSLFKKAVWKY